MKMERISETGTSKISKRSRRELDFVWWSRVVKYNLSMLAKAIMLFNFEKDVKKDHIFFFLEERGGIV